MLAKQDFCGLEHGDGGALGGGVVVGGKEGEVERQILPAAIRA